MARILKSPAVYVQDKHVLQTWSRYVVGMGTRFLIVISQGGMNRFRGDMDRAAADKKFSLYYEIFTGECTYAKVEELAQKAKDHSCSAIIGLGGGRILDASKAAARLAGAKAVVIPTIAATDAPCSSLSVLYHENGEFDRYLFHDHGPDLVLVDTEVIADAPAEFLVAGMGDAMSTWFEARACRASDSYNQVHGYPTRAATNLAYLCWELLQSYGIQAAKDARNGLCSEAVETIVETNTYLSSVGFESGGLAGAHAIQKGFSMIGKLRGLHHGYLIAFCTLVQLVMEKATRDEIDLVIHFCKKVGLPTCFRELGYADISNEELLLVAKKACAEGSTMHHMPFTVRESMVYEAMIQADILGRE